MELDRNMHSVFLLNYHLVLVTKYRRQVFDDEISVRAKEIFEYIGANYHITLVEWNHDKDHVHILFRAHPNTQLSRFLNAYKSASSRLLKKEFPRIREKLWKEAFWSQSFCLLTTGGAPVEVLRQYIESQGMNEKKGKRRGKEPTDREESLSLSDRAKRRTEDFVCKNIWMCAFYL